MVVDQQTDTRVVPRLIKGLVESLRAEMTTKLLILKIMFYVDNVYCDNFVNRVLQRVSLTVVHIFAWARHVYP